MTADQKLDLEDFLRAARANLLEVRHKLRLAAMGDTQLTAALEHAVAADMNIKMAIDLGKAAQ